MTNKETRDFILTHANEDVRSLAFKASQTAGVDVSFALDQITGKQIARTKLPRWAEAEGIVFPPHISMEQCSSEQTALYKTKILQGFLSKLHSNTNNDSALRNNIFCDFTGGFGVDFSYLAPLFNRSIYIERQEHLCEIARNNFPLLNLKNTEVINADAEDIINKMKEENKEHLVCKEKDEQRVFFLDPARRDIQGKRTFAISDCTPNILGFVDVLLSKSDVVMLKLSPMLDWHATVSDINNATKKGDVVREVHIVSTNNECKELLLILSSKTKDPLRVICTNNDESFIFSPSEDNNEACASEANNMDRASEVSDETADFLLVPNASIMKAGCFELLEERFPVRQISANSHIFLSNKEVEEFPGRQFKVSAVSSMNKKELRQTLKGIERANISTRNFPLKPEELRKRLKLKDGGDTYIFATTNKLKEHIIYVCNRSVTV